MICTVGGHADFTAITNYVAFNLQIPADENWYFLSCHAGIDPLEIIRVRIFLNTILTYDLVFANYMLPYHINQLLRGGTVVQMEISLQVVSPHEFGAFMLVNRIKS